MAEIGKNIIENLTSAMYENSYTVYREYIQNAADSIDKAVANGLLTKQSAYIDIDINVNKRLISIYDNAYGIPKAKFYKVLSDIADSEKNRTKDKGFRGIGRLAGIAYCKKLIFKSSFAGEDVVSIMIWDGELLRSILADTTQHPSASDLVDMLITTKEEKAKIEEHFFEVIMEDVIPESDNLIDEHSVIEYLQAVAPIPYSNTFVFRSKIYDFAKENNLSIDEYKIEINGNPIYKPYKTTIYEGTEGNKTPFDEITDIQFELLKGSKNEILGWMWYGISRFEKQLPIINSMRGMRIRKENIQIGSEETLGYPKFFKEPRGNHYFFGEIFAVHADLIPNARRDYFNTNSTLSEFEKVLYPILHNQFYSLYHFANKVKNSAKKLVEHAKRQETFDIKVENSEFISKQDQEKAQKELDASKESAKKAQHELELRKKEAEKSEVFTRVFNAINTVYKPEDTSNTHNYKNSDNKKKKEAYLSHALSRYSKKEQKLIGNIYDIIKKILPQETAELVIKKIQEELK